MTQTFSEARRLPVRTAVILALTVLLAGGLACADVEPIELKDFTDEQVESAIDKAVAYLWSQQKEDGHWGEFGRNGRDYPVGHTAIICYALLESGESTQSPKMAKALKWLSEQETDWVYGLAFRANAFYAASRQNDRVPWGRGLTFTQLLAKDVRVLVASTTSDGGYTYRAPGHTPEGREIADFARGWGGSDNSNAQYGLLAVWCGQRAGIHVPGQYWTQTRDYWKKMQIDGGWGYTPSTQHRRAPYPSMTVAGLASLFICYDYANPHNVKRCNRRDTLQPIDDGLAWLGKRFKGSVENSRWPYYYLYGIERVGLASGLKYFGEIDWYRYGVNYLLAEQNPRGYWDCRENWGSRLSKTSYALLFLSRGRRAVLFNKLQYSGDWNNRPRDLAMLTRWLNDTFETTVNWQIINLSVPVDQWHDAPILVISGSKAPRFTDDEISRLRQYVMQGGTILSIAECGSKAFTEAMQAAYKRAFPEHELTECQPGHRVYSINYKLEGRPALWEVSNGVRPLAVHSADDLTLAWQFQAADTMGYAFQGLFNILAYTKGAGTLGPDGGLRSRGQSHWPTAWKGSPSRYVRVARIATEGNWNPEPLAYQRFARRMGHRTNTRVQVVDGVPPDKLADADANLAVLSGTGEFELNFSQRKAIRQYIEAGGTLLIDAAGGDRAFYRSASRLVDQMFPRERPRNLVATDPLLRLKGYAIDKVRFRRATRKVAGASAEAPPMRAIYLKGRPVVYLSAEDITAGLVGYPSDTIHGYTPDSAYELLRNMALSVADEPETKPAQEKPGSGWDAW